MHVEMFGGVSSDHVHGLVSFRVTLPDELVGRVTSVQATISGRCHRANVHGNSALFTLVSHRIDDGRQTMTLEAWDSSHSQPLTSRHLPIFVNNSRGIGKKVSAELAQRDFPAFFPEDIGNELFPDLESTKNLAPWFDRDDAMMRLERMKLENENLEKASIQHFIHDGFFVARNLLPDSEIDAAAKALLDAATSGWDGYQPGSSQRMHHLHSQSPAVAAIWKHPKIVSILKTLFDAEPLFVQTLSYLHGSEQELHQDTIHLSSFPCGNMIGVWVALEDVREGSGELEYIRGSHRWPRVYRRDVGCEVVRNDWSQFAGTVVEKWKSMAGGRRGEAFMAKKGDVLFWHENLMHGGRMRVDMAQTRMSIVSHYFTSGSLVYYDSTGIVGYTKHLS